MRSKNCTIQLTDSAPERYRKTFKEGAAWGAMSPHFKAVRVGIELMPRVGIELMPRVGIELMPRVGIETMPRVGIETMPSLWGGLRRRPTWVLPGSGFGQLAIVLTPATVDGHQVRNVKVP